LPVAELKRAVLPPKSARRDLRGGRGPPQVVVGNSSGTLLFYWNVRKEFKMNARLVAQTDLLEFYVSRSGLYWGEPVTDRNLV
jgi:hypothetical protein